jgi:hypothetical protein
MARHQRIIARNRGVRADDGGTAVVKQFRTRCMQYAMNFHATGCATAAAKWLPASDATGR